jgi:hypothetical protein
MFWKKKMQKEIDDNYLSIRDLEIKIEQLECTHNFVFDKWAEREVVLYISYPGRFGKLIYKCRDCGKIKTEYWKYLTKKKQQSFRNLNLVPEDWKVKVKA